MLTPSTLMQPNPPLGIHSGICSLCGLSGEGQYLRNEILEKASANLTALFDLNQNTICAHCVAVWREPKKWHRGICATETGVLFPVISIESVTEDRPLWADTLRGLDGSPRVIVLTTDPKKRVWPFARISSGDSVCIYFHDPHRPDRRINGIVMKRVSFGVSCNLWISLIEFGKTLAIIESAYEAGFNKEVIRTSLFSNFNQAVAAGHRVVAGFEQSLIPIRQTPEFMPALIMAQRKPINVDTQTLPVHRNGNGQHRARRSRGEQLRPE